MCVEVSSCSLGWVLSGSSCYRRFNSKKTWDDAKAACFNEGGYLVSIESGSENTVVYDIEGNNNRENVWIGLNKKTGNIVWSDGTALTYKNWHNKLNNKYDCVRMRKNSEWDYEDCTDDQYYVCERPVPTTNTSTTIGMNLY